MRPTLVLFVCLAVLALAKPSHTKPLHPKPVLPKGPSRPGGAVVAPKTRLLNQARAIELVKRLAAVRGCNANICFAIDGSGSITAREFKHEKEFVQDVGSIVSVDHAVELAAVQYATSNTAVSPLTVDFEKFNLRVENARQQRGASFVTGGLNYCMAQLYRRPFEANKIILLGDGIENIGSKAFKRAAWFRRNRGDISVVAAGRANFKALKKIVGGDEDRIFKIKDFFDVLSLQLIIEELTLDVCGINPRLD